MRYQDDDSGDTTPSHGICGKCAYAQYKQAGWLDESGTQEVLDALKKRPESGLLGEFKQYFPDVCYEGFETFRQQIAEHTGEIATNSLKQHSDIEQRK